MPMRSAQTYTVPELARTLGVTGAVRGWIRQGLPALNTQRPTLIMGSEAKEFLTERRQAKKRPLHPDEVYCLSCKAPRKFFENMVQLEQLPGKPVRITGFCAICEGSASRVVGAAQIGELERFFEVSGNKDEAA
ncbi:helix-turn-helix domain-containing protein [Defluviimonas sp. WL0050]|uniref:Helix-turn-helix domain-containing protein n=1 Tax=Albidovulum litorale TaxID=2984134 RepID=A0ABT2ZNT0_9RHOB|nr:helix-turn-helix domain-containing protein [Defluviimonas sp. WL0050]MCV2872722.1 helix-turn-helix domain-containing protein [Defluviimonas sp. WL0050]